MNRYLYMSIFKRPEYKSEFAGWILGGFDVGNHAYLMGHKNIVTANIAWAAGSDNIAMRPPDEYR